MPVAGSFLLFERAVSHVAADLPTSSVSECHSDDSDALAFRYVFRRRVCLDVASQERALYFECRFRYCRRRRSSPPGGYSRGSLGDTGNLEVCVPKGVGSGSLASASTPGGFLDSCLTTAERPPLQATLCVQAVHVLESIVI